VKATISDTPRPSGATYTRRRLLALAGVGAVGLVGADTVGRLGAPAASPLPVHPAVAQLRSRPDLRPPGVTVTTARSDRAAGLIFIAPYPQPAQGGPLIFDDRGEPVWFLPLHADQAANLQVQSYRGRPVLTWWQGKINKLGQGTGKAIIADTSYRHLASVRGALGQSVDLHEFRLTGAGTALITAFSTVPADLSHVGGPVAGQVSESVVQEIDVASGRLLLDWHSLDHVALTESYSPVGEPYDYIHANSVDVDRDGNLIVCARNTHAVYKIDRRSGQVIWRLGGKRSDFAMGPGTTFAWQHDARRQADGSLTLFDDAASPAAERQSRGLVLVLDERRRSASLRRSYVHPQPLLAASQGNVQVLPDGHALVGWGAQPYISEFDGAGDLVFDAHMHAPGQSYRALRQPWAAAPGEPPTVVLVRTSGPTVAYVSWNGATAVASWVLLSGLSDTRLRPVAARARAGFETAIPVAQTSRYVAVRALDAHGRALAQSPAIAA